MVCFVRAFCVVMCCAQNCCMYDVLCSHVYMCIALCGCCGKSCASHARTQMEREAMIRLMAVEQQQHIAAMVRDAAAQAAAAVPK